MNNQPPGAIVQYANNVFTNAGQSTVDAFKAKLNSNAKSALSQVVGLKVYAGYHGKPDGNFSAYFSTNEMDEVREMLKQFTNAKLEPLTAPMSDDDIVAAVRDQNVFFTWCDSDKKINDVMNRRKDPLKNRKVL